MKTKEELNSLKEEVETVSKKLHELTDEELAQVVGGVVPRDKVPNGKIHATALKDGKVATVVMATADDFAGQN